MKLQHADGVTLNLKPLSDVDYERARATSSKSLDICPTCGGRDKRIDGSGMKQWESPGYVLKGEHHACNCPAQMALYARYMLANIGEQYMRLDWDDFAGTAAADRQVRDYTAHWHNYLMHGFGLSFASVRQGVGKTWAATQIGKELVKQRQTVYFLDFVQMIDAFMGDHQEKRDVEARMREPTLLILDDVRAGISDRQTELYALKFEVVMRHRTNFNLPTIFTTNLTDVGFETEFPRIYSLISPKQMWIEMDGADYRKMSQTAAETTEMIFRGEVRPIT